MKHYLFAAILLVVSVSQEACTGESYQEKEQARKAAETKRDAQRAQAIAEYSKTYNADTTWRKSLEGKSPLTLPWTLTIQDSLVRADGRPIAGYAVLLDVARKDGGYVFDLALPPYSLSLKQNLVFRLECNPPRFEIPKDADLIQVMTGGFNGEENYMFAARIHNVKRAIMRLDARANGEEEAEVEVSTGTRFIASGECLDLKYIGGMEKEAAASAPAGATPPAKPDEPPIRREDKSMR